MKKLGWLGSQTRDPATPVADDSPQLLISLEPDPPGEDVPPPPSPTWFLDASYHGQNHTLSYETEEDALAVYEYLTTTEDVWWFTSYPGRLGGSTFAFRVASIDAVSIRPYQPHRY